MFNDPLGDKADYSADWAYIIYFAQNYYGGSYNANQGWSFYNSNLEGFYAGAENISRNGIWGLYDGWASDYMMAAGRYNSDGPGGAITNVSPGGYITTGIFYHNADGTPKTIDGMSGHFATYFVGNRSTQRNAQGNGGGESADYLLAKLYWHNQFGGGADYNINASTLDFSGTSQRELGLTGMKPGASKNVHLFNSGINPNSLAFGNLEMTYKGNNQFSITSNPFDFDYQSTASFERNAGTFVGGAVFGQFYTIPITPFSILRDVTGFGGSFMINFKGTVTIPK